MVRHDLKSTSEDEFHQQRAPDAADSASAADKFRAQLDSSQRLNEYYNQVVAEIRASLNRARGGG